MMNECSSWPRSNVTRTSTREAGYFDGRARLRSGVAWLALSTVCGWNACAWGAPMLDPVLAPKPDAAREALLLGRYALTVKATPSGANQRAVKGEWFGSADLMALLTENASTASDTSDPREFGFDAGRTWAGQPRPENAAGLRPGHTRDVNRGLTIREQLKPLFSVTTRNVGAGGAHGPTERAFPQWPVVPRQALPKPQAVLGDASLGATTYSGAPAFSPGSVGFTNIGSGQLAGGVLEDIATLIEVTPKGRSTTATAGSRGNAFEYGPVPSLSPMAFVKQVVTALLTTPWTYLGLAVLVIWRLLASGLRPARQ